MSLPEQCRLKSDRDYRAGNILARMRHHFPLLRMHAFGELLDHLLVKCRDIVRFAAGDEAVVHDHLGIHPLRSCVPEVVLDCWP